MAVNPHPNSDLDDIFEYALQLENTFHQEGLEAGTIEGYSDGLLQGKHLGIEKGFCTAYELGFYYGASYAIELINAHHSLDALTSDIEECSSYLPSQQEKVAKNISSMQSMMNNLIVTDNQQLGHIIDNMQYIRNKFRMVGAQAGLRLRYEGPTLDQVEEKHIAHESTMIIPEF